MMEKDLILDLILEELKGDFPFIYNYVGTIEQLIPEKPSLENKNQFIYGTEKKPGILIKLISFLSKTDYISSYVDNEVKNFNVLDWNQRRILKRFLSKLVIESILRSEELGYNKEEVSRFIKNNLPFAEIDTSQIPSYRDYRLKENLVELVKRNTLARALGGDTDHYHDCLVGADYLKLDNEQKCWYSMLFGYTYRAQFASLAIQLWPYPHTQNIDDVAEWCGKTKIINEDQSISFSNNEDSMNMGLIIVGKDCKYSKSKMPEFFHSVQTLSDGGKLFEKLYEAAHRSDDPNQNYLNLNNLLRDNIWGAGRFKVFLMMQQLYSFFNWPINGYLCDLEEEGSWSCRIGQVAVMTGLDNATEKEIIDSAQKNPSTELVQKMEIHTKELLEELNRDLLFDTDVYEYESIQCEILDKYLLKCREFSNWTSIEKSDLVSHSYNNWFNNYRPTKAYPNCPDLKVLFLPQISKRPHTICDGWLDEKWMLTLNHLGIPSFHNLMLTGEVDIETYLPVRSRNEVVNEEMKSLLNKLFTKEEIKEIQELYDPRLYLRWKKIIDKNSKYYLILVQEEKNFIDKLDLLESENRLYHQRV